MIEIIFKEVPPYSIGFWHLYKDGVLICINTNRYTVEKVAKTLGNSI